MAVENVKRPFLKSEKKNVKYIFSNIFFLTITVSFLLTFPSPNHL